ncbi:hypothetical protein SPX_26650 [Sporomusa paucivorans]
MLGSVRGWQRNLSSYRDRPGGAWVQGLWENVEYVPTDKGRKHYKEAEINKLEYYRLNL